MKLVMIGMVVVAAAVLAPGSPAYAQEAVVPAPAGDFPAQVAACPVDDPDCLPPPDPGPKCLTQPAPPPSGFARYACRFMVTDAYGRPAANTPVRLETRWCNKFGSRLRATTTGVTDAQGRRTLSFNSPSANVIECSIDREGDAEPVFQGASSKTHKTVAKLPTGTSVSFETKVQPVPSVTRALAGAQPGEGRVDLYQSGPYDKALVIVEQFDQLEHGQGRRERRRFWRQLSSLLTVLFNDGWDVWLAQPHDTGDSFHEQAAEAAQAFAAAARAYPFRPLCAAPTVGVLGFNTGGLVGRIATARWEADAAWRAQLGLPAALPVRFVATFDAPHYGMHLNLDMQESLWENRTAADITTRTNLDSCAASQMLRGRFDPATRRRTNGDFLNFFVNGTATRFFTKNDGVDHVCAAGPAVATLNAAAGVPGWPSKPVRIGFTQSSAGDRTKCFSDARHNKNGSGQDLCKFVTEVSSAPTFAPSAGQTWLRFFADDPGLPDVCPDEFWDAEDRVEWSDITPGSRNPLFLDGFVTVVARLGLFCQVFAHQRFPTTLVPFVSAAGTQGPRGGAPYSAIPTPFHELHPSAQSRVADVVDPNDGILLVGRLKAFPPGCTDLVVQP
jgi:hypothetical protein